MKVLSRAKKIMSGRVHRAKVVASSGLGRRRSVVVRAPRSIILRSHAFKLDFRISSITLTKKVGINFEGNFQENFLKFPFLKICSNKV
jgi:hypothetical protein